MSSTKDPIKYRLESIKVRGVNYTNDKSEAVVSKDAISVNIKFNIVSNGEEKTIKCMLRIFYINKIVAKEILYAAIDYTFYIDNYHDVIQTKDENNTITPDALLREILNISLNTSRGIIHAKTEATLLDFVIMPIIDPMTLISRMKDYPTGDGSSM